MVTINDVARKAGVAISTVSNIINGTRYVSPETTAKVMRVIEQLGYEADPVARNMKSARSNTMGLIITNFSRVFFAPILQTCREIATESGYTLWCAESNDDFTLERHYVDTMKRNRFDAIILDSVADPDDAEYFALLAELSSKQKQIAVVCIEMDAIRYGLDCVETGDFDGAVIATGHLVDQGRQNILHITGPPISGPAERRALGCLHRLAESGRKPRIVIGDYSPHSGYNLVKELIAQEGRLTFDGIFAANDQMAVGALRALRELGYRVPEDVAVVGYDDVFVSSLTDPPLTSVRIPRAEIGRQAMELAAIRIADFDAPPILRRLDPYLIVRGSSDPDAPLNEHYVTW